MPDAVSLAVLLVGLSGAPVPGQCQASVPPGTTQRKQDAEAFNAKSFAKALAQKGLTFAPLASVPATEADRILYRQDTHHTQT